MYGIGFIIFEISKYFLLFMLALWLFDVAHTAGKFIPYLLFEAIQQHKLIELSALVISIIALAYAILSPVWTTDQLSKRIDTLEQNIKSIQSSKK